MIIASHIKTKKNEAPMTKKQLLTTILLIMAISMTGYSNLAYAVITDISGLSSDTVGLPANNVNSLDVDWTDASTDDPGTDGVLVETFIEISDDSFTSIIESVSVANGAQTHTFNSLNPNTTYDVRAISNFATAGNQTAVTTTGTTNTDSEVPAITGTGSSQTIELELVNSFSLPTPTVSDNDSNYSEVVTVGGDTPDTSVVGVYTITFSAPDDASLNSATGGNDVVVTVSDTTVPTLAPNQADPFELFVGDVVPTLDVTVSDNDKSVNGNVIACNMSGVDTNTPGFDPATCDFTDPSGNDAVQYEYVVHISATIPTAPTSLSASLTVASEDSSVDLTWTAPSSDGGSAITNYVVEYGTATGVYGAPINTPDTTTSFTVSPLSENTEYFFIVRAENAIGVNGASNEDSITTFGVPELVLSFDGATVNSVTVDWVIDANGGTISALDVERSLDGVSFADIEETETLGIDFIVDGSLTADTDYYYRMTATNEFGTSTVTLSDPASIMTTNLPVIDAVSDVSIRFGASYVDTIPECTDTEDGVIVATSTGTINSFLTGIQTITYDCQDSDGNDAISVVRSVTVSKSGGGSGDRHKSAPTSGKDWKTDRQIVDGGFKMNNVSFVLDDNWHTDFAKQNVKVGSLNSFAAKTFAQNGGLWIQEFAFGIPKVGEYNDAEALVEVHYNYDKTIEEIKIIQNSGVINESSLFATTNQVSCDDDGSMKCYSTELKFIFDEPLKDDVMAINSIDFSRRSMHPTFLNEGINVFGDSLTPSNTLQIAGTEKYEGLITVTQSEKYSDLWIAEDGRIFEMFGESDSFKLVNREIDGTMNDRVSDELKQWTQKNALSVFDSAGVQGSDKGFVTIEYPDIDSRTQFLLDHDLTGLTRGY